MAFYDLSDLLEHRVNLVQRDQPDLSFQLKSLFEGGKKKLQFKRRET